jgi:spermidine/putrescine transport system substrate-binding protein
VTRRSFFLMGVAGIAGCHLERRPRLNVFNWSNYVAPDTVPNFEKELGVHVRYAVYESNEEMLARVMTGNSGWDVVFPTNYLIEPLRESGLLAPLDHAKLSNLDQLDPLFQKPSWDPGLRWSVPYMWNATGIAYRKTLTPAPVRWQSMWNPALAGKITMLDDPVDVFAACLKKLGDSMNTRHEGQLRQAQKEAIAQKPLLRAYLNAEVRDQLVSGDVLAAQLWSTTAQQAMDASADVAFAYPEEGFAVYPDTAVLLAESPRKSLAHEFINYLLRPKVAADIVIGARTATANGGAKSLLPPEIQALETLFPSVETMRRAEWAEAATPAVQRLRDRLWTEIKSS